MRTSLTFASLLFAGFLAAGCDNDGPMEEAGEAIDDAAESLGDAGNDIRNAIEDACEEVKEGAGAKNRNC